MRAERLRDELVATQSRIIHHCNDLGYYC